MEYYKMSKAGHFIDVVSEEDLGNFKKAMESNGFVFEETKCVEPPNEVSLEFICGKCGYKMWIFGFNAATDVEVEVECDMCETEHTLIKQDDGSWRVEMVPEDQVVLHDDVEVE